MVTTMSCACSFEDRYGVAAIGRERPHRLCLTFFIRSAWAALRSGVHEALMFAPMALRSIFNRPVSCRRSCTARHSLFAQRSLKALDFFAFASGVAASWEFLALFSGVKVASIGLTRAARASAERFIQFFLREPITLARYVGSRQRRLRAMPRFTRVSADGGPRLLKLSSMRARELGSDHCFFILSEWARRDSVLTAR